MDTGIQTPVLILVQIVHLHIESSSSPETQNLDYELSVCLLDIRWAFHDKAVIAIMQMSLGGGAMKI